MNSISENFIEGGNRENLEAALKYYVSIGGAVDLLPRGLSDHEIVTAKAEFDRIVSRATMIVPEVSVAEMKEIRGKDVMKDKVRVNGEESDSDVKPNPKLEFPALANAAKILGISDFNSAAKDLSVVVESYNTQMAQLDGAYEKFGPDLEQKKIMEEAKLMLSAALLVFNSREDINEKDSAESFAAVAKAKKLCEGKSFSLGAIKIHNTATGLEAGSR